MVSAQSEARNHPRRDFQRGLSVRGRRTGERAGEQGQAGERAGTSWAGEQATAPPGPESRGYTHSIAVGVA